MVDPAQNNFTSDSTPDPSLGSTPNNVFTNPVPEPTYPSEAYTATPEAPNYGSTAPLGPQPEPTLEETMGQTYQPTPEYAPEMPNAEPVGFNAASNADSFNSPLTQPENITPPPPPPSSLKSSGQGAQKAIFVAVAVILVVIFATIGYFIYDYIVGNKQPEESITLTYWGLWEPTENIQPLIDAYEKDHPNVHIKYENRSPEYYLETLVSRLGKDSGPDIVRVHNSWVSPLSEKLSPVPTTVMSKDEYEKTFYKGAISTLMVNDAYYGIPYMYDGLALIYNETLFKEAGIKQTPKTWEEFREVAKKLTKKNDSGEITQAGAAIGFSNIEFSTDVVGLLMAQNGVEFVDEKGAANFDKTISPDGRNLGAEALSFYTLFSKGDDLVWNNNWTSVSEAFAEGTVGMMFAPSWRVMNLLEANKNLKIKVGAVPQIPLGEDSTTNVNWGSFWSEAVSSTAKNQAVSWDFLKYMSEREQLVKMYTIASEKRTFGEPYARQDLYSTLSSDPYLSPYVKSAATATGWAMCDRTYDSIYNDKIKTAISVAVDEINQNGGAEEAVQKAAKQAIVVISTLSSQISK